MSPSAVEWELSVTSIDATHEKAERVSEIRLYSIEVQPSSGEQTKLFIAAWSRGISGGEGASWLCPGAPARQKSAALFVVNVINRSSC